jgi:hypothetical protein
MNKLSLSRTSKQFALLVTLLGVLVFVLSVALAEITVSAHAGGGGNDCIIGCDKPHDASMDSLSCTQCHTFQNNGLAKVGQTMNSGERDTWYAPLLTGAGILLGELPE